MRIGERIKHAITIFTRWVELYPWRFTIALLVIITSILMVSEPAWFIAAVDSMRIPYAVFLVAFITFFFIRSNYALTTAGVLALLILAPGIWPYFKTSAETPLEKKQESAKETKGADFSVLHFNVKENNKHILSVAQSAIISDADIVSMQELKESSFSVVDTMMLKSYPYTLSDLSIKGFGLAVYSKYPIIEKKIITEHGFPILTGKIKIKDHTINFISATTSTPTNDAGYQKQIKQFKLIGEIVKQTEGPIILMGDMNAVPWSEQVKKLLEETKLKDSRKDLAATYPAQSPLQIPIDYIFHSPNIYCQKFSTIAGTSSNHLGIIGYYDFERKKSKEGIKDIIR
ncbi:MAG: endonuclease/exonuclease/phosphatase family protein [Chitinophagales bacterium]